MIASNPLWIVLVSSAEKKAYVSGRGDPTEDGYVSARHLLAITVSFRMLYIA